MYVVCLDIKTNEMTITTAIERDMMISALQSVKEPVPTFVLKRTETKEEAEAYIEEIKKINNLIDEL